MSLRNIIAPCLMLAPVLTASGQALPQLGRDPVNQVIGAMTVEEKAKLLVGMGFPANIPGVPPMDPEDAMIPEKVPGAAGRTHAIPRLGIPSLTLADGPAGVRIDPTRENDSTRTFYATAFPVATLLASSWDTSIVREVGKAFGEEARDYGVDILLAPGMNIHRNPLGGRNFEYYSEDPLVSGRMAVAFVEGVESQGVGTSIKHFVANNEEFNRMQLNTVVSERALREIYLRGFEIAVTEGRPLTVMSAYNRINGTYASQYADLLTGVLRDEWGFEGFVMTDWFGGRDPVAQMEAGNDLLMPGIPTQTEAIVLAVKNGTLSEDVLDRNVERVLRIIPESHAFAGAAYSNKPDLSGHALLARHAASEGMVLLKNEGAALPLASGQTVALFGNASYDPILGGTGSGDVNEAYSVPLSQGLRNVDLQIDEPLEQTYESYIKEQKEKQPRPRFAFMLPPPIPGLTVSREMIDKAVERSDAAVISVGRNSGEFQDRPEDDFYLSEQERQLIEWVSHSFRAAAKPVVLVLNIGGVIEVNSWRASADAILLAWQPGQEAGNAIADVLSGRVNPSGKLPMTFPVRYEDVPSAANFPGHELPNQEEPPQRGLFGVPSEVVYDEGIYVGYRHYATRGVEPAYEFGYGLSYTDFEYSGLTLDDSNFDSEVEATVAVRNSGEVAGREVVQLYVTAPEGALDKPEIELRAFQKTRLLPPGESQTLSFTLSARDLASYDPGRRAWVAEAGTYRIRVGTSSARFRAEATLTLPHTVVAVKVSGALKAMH